METFALSGADSNEFIPDENIFDFSYYWNVLLQRAKLYNSSILADSGNMHRSLFFCQILNVVILYFGFCYLYKIYHDDTDDIFVGIKEN